MWTAVWPGRVKPSTLADYRQMLTPRDAEARPRGRCRAGRIMAEFDGEEPRSITTAQVERFLAGLDTKPISKRSVNKHRQCQRAERRARDRLDVALGSVAEEDKRPHAALAATERNSLRLATT